jgi:acyl dehydratase
MAVDISYKGRQFPPYQIEVERCKIKELCLAIGDDNSIFFDPAAAKKQGYADSPAPLTYATLMSFWGYPEIWARMTEMGIDVKRLLHAKEEYEYSSPIYPGDKLAAAISVDSLRSGAMDMATFKTDFKRNEETVLTARMTIIVPPKK